MLDYLWDQLAHESNSIQPDGTPTREIQTTKLKGYLEMKSYGAAFKKYAVFEGRTSRSDFWLFVLFNFIFSVIAVVLDNLIGTAYSRSGYGIIYTLYALATFLPSLAVTVRRLHDTDKSGGWIFISLIPFGSIVLLVFLCTEGTPGFNRFGDNPYMESTTASGYSNSYSGGPYSDYSSPGSYPENPYGRYPNPPYQGYPYSSPNSGPYPGTPPYGGNPAGGPYNTFYSGSGSIPDRPYDAQNSTSGDVSSPDVPASGSTDENSTL